MVEGLSKPQEVTVIKNFGHSRRSNLSQKAIQLQGRLRSKSIADCEPKEEFRLKEGLFPIKVRSHPKLSAQVNSQAQAKVEITGQSADDLNLEDSTIQCLIQQLAQ